jgi:hypothetical protein
VPNYVEPFAGSLAVLLGRPHPAGTETVNDADCYLANFWRAVQSDPDAVARYADWPVNEADLLARHRWLLAQDGFKAAMRDDPAYCDAKIAGWWVWGLCAWIGSGWCRQEAAQLPHLGDAGQGINRKLPHLGDAGRGIADYFAELADRLRRVRVACGDWSRILGDSVTWRHGVTGVLLDPPYDDDEHSVRYSAHSSVAADVAAWARDHGADPRLRIALCGYSGEHSLPGWVCVPWKAQGGFGSQGNGRGRENAARECIWFSPHCIGSHESTPLFSVAAAS